MKLKIKRDLLLDGLSKVSKALSSKNLVPVLAGIKFDLDEKGLTLTASDNDITIQIFLEINENIKIDKEGSIIIQGRHIFELVRKLQEEYINIEVIDDSKILISTDNSKFDLPGINKSEYPSINLEGNKNPVLINNKEFKNMINQTSFATSNDEYRPILTGINFKIVGNVLECNATDSYRLSRKIINLDKASEETYNIVIPSKNLIELIRIMDDSENDLELHIFNNKILVKYENILFQSRLISGTYPNTSNLIPEEYLLNIRININELYSVIDRAGVFTTDKEKNIVTFEIEDNKLFVKSVSSENGRTEEKLDVEKNNKENIKISFVAKYMMEALKSFSDLDVEINFVGEVKPIVLKSNVDNDLIQLVLPIRTY